MQTRTTTWRALPLSVVVALAAAALAFLFGGVFTGQWSKAHGGAIDTSGVTCADVYLAELQVPIANPLTITPGDAPATTNIGVAQSITYSKHDLSDDTTSSAGSTYNSGIPGVIAGTLPFPLPASIRCAQYDKTVATVTSNPVTPTDPATINVTPNGSNPPLVDMIVFWNSDNAAQRGYWRITAAPGTSVTMKKTASACNGTPTSGFDVAPGTLHACITVAKGLDPIAFNDEDVTNNTLNGNTPRGDFNQCPNFVTFTQGSCFNQGTLTSQSLSCGVSTGKQEGGGQNAWTRTEIRVIANVDSSKKSPSFGTATLFNPTTPGTCADIAGQTNRSTNIVVVWSLDSAAIDGATTNWTSDYDGDGCKNFQELDQPQPQRLGSSPTFTGGRDPFNPGDCQTSLVGEWSMEVRAVPVTLDGGNNPVAGKYFHCITVIEQAGNALTAPIYCYTDDPTVTVNPQTAGTGACPPAAAALCGDGFTGAPYPVSTSPPPEPYGDIDNPQSSFTGTYTPASDTFTLSGCLNNTEGTDIYMKATGIDRLTGNGNVDVWVGRPDCTDPGVATPTYTGVDLQMSKQAYDTTDVRYDYRENDYDHDGCSARQELGSTANQGGLRDPVNGNDHYDVNIVGGVWTPDGFINLPTDILGVAAEFGPTADAPGITESERAADKSPTLAGAAGSWNRKGGDGTVNIPDDILGVASQFGHNC